MAHGAHKDQFQACETGEGGKAQDLDFLDRLPLQAEREQDTAELDAVVPEPEPQPVAVQPQLDGVTQSADWGFDDPEDYSAPV